jgi:hypothetical protein
MERLLAPGERLDSAAISKHSKPQLAQAEIMRLDELMLRTVAYYPNQEMAAETFTEFRLELQNLAALHGVKAVEDGVQGMRLKSRFFPHPTDVAEQIEARLAIEREEDRLERESVFRQQQQAEQAAVQAAGGFVTMGEIYAEFEEKRRKDSEVTE